MFMQCTKDILEIIYYIAFIVLTYLIVKYAKQTYILQSSKNSKLLCKIFVKASNVENGMFPFYLEIYNFGNDVAKDIEVFFYETKITTIDFIKQNESYYFPLGNVVQTLAGNRVFILDNKKEIENDTTIHIKLLMQEKTSVFEMSTDILFASRSTENATDKIVDAVNDVTRAIEKLK